MGRHDFNVIGATLLLLSIAVYYKKKPELVHRFNVQILLVLVLIDVFWLLIMSFVWSHDDSDSEYWKELTTLHGLVKFGVWGELLLSSAIIVILFFDYKEAYGKIINPLDFNYESKNDDPMINF